MNSLVSLSLLLLAGCPGPTEATLTDVVIAPDLDGDGSPNELDCDDARADVFPGALELANGMDDDCDGVVDNGTERFDDDGDGFTELAGDCDDTNREVYPGRAEIPYDGVDQDCSLGDLEDVDHDGYASDLVGGTDCDDERADVNVDVAEVANGRDDDCDSVVDEGTTNFDDDGDGYSEVTGDCDDGDPRTSPDAVEVEYDGVDNDCDGLDLRDMDGDGQDALVVGGNDCDDEDPLVYAEAPEIPYDGFDQDCDGKDSADFDGDGYDSTVVFGGTDCNDANIDVNPGRTEEGDYLDNDCDGAVDEDTEYGDDDLDGFAEIAGDCDDAAPDINPSEVELCGDGLDQNCDGSTNGCGIGGDMDLADSDLRLVGGTSYENVGYSVNGAGDLTDDGSLDFVVGIYGSDSNGYDSGAVEIVDADASSGSGTSAGLTLAGESNYAYAGYSTHGGGDLDGDGTADLMVGAYGYTGTASYQGRAYVVLGPITAAGGLGTLKDSYMDGSTSYVYMGSDGKVAGDVTGDGSDDVLASAYYAQVGSYYGAGEVYIQDGDALSSGVGTSVADAIIQGQTSYGYLGTSLSTGDWNGDGAEDVASGAYGDGTGGYYAGTVFIHLGPVTGTTKATDADTKVVGPASYTYLGQAVADGRDVDGDGTDDFMTGAYYANYGTSYGVGAAYLFYGPLSSGTVTTSSGGDASYYGGTNYDYAGRAVELPGDVNGDGHGDALVGSYGADAGGTTSGAAYVVFGPLSGALLLNSLGVDGATLAGEATSDQAGWVVGGPGDLDGDGNDEVLVGAPYHKEGTSYSAGSAYLLFGGVGL